MRSVMRPRKPVEMPHRRRTELVYSIGGLCLFECLRMNGLDHAVDAVSLSIVVEAFAILLRLAVKKRRGRGIER